MDLDDELRRLFSEPGDGLDVPVRPDAEQVIVAGARRVRRRRVGAATAGGAMAVVAVVGGAVLLGGAPDAMPPATGSHTTSQTVSVTTTSVSTTTTTTPPVSTTSTWQPATDEPEETVGSTEKVWPPPKLAFAVLGPTGVGQLRLGQRAEHALATGQLHVGDELVQPSCTAYRMVVDGREIGFAYVSLPAAGNQVELISSSVLRTPEGAGPGWTARQVADVYPAFDAASAEADGYGAVAVPGNPAAAYQFWFEADGRMSGFNLRRTGQPCDPT